MIRYQELIGAVAERAQLADEDDARSAVKAVLAGIAHWSDVPQRQVIAEALPTELRYILESPRATVGGDLGRFLQFVAFVTDTTPESARYDTQAVLSYLDAADPRVTELLRAQLPAEFAQLFSAPVAESPRPAPSPSTAAPAPTPVPPPQPAEPEPAAPRPARVRPTELTADELARVLTRLPGWRGNTRRLTRTVTLPAADRPEVLDRVHHVESELDHHAQVREEPHDLTFTLWTHTQDAVTELDVRLAERISDILARL
ncbi:MAG: hypothetical protein QOC93_3568 [Actinomycetota bacterium]|jgi:pterin-4a-carbinolamine dehydratase/uncharacterized protein (DUF2267 family)|nr:hypothetical protein [Cryptosporangiaceae bacterium]MDQ1678424.1 hypothetical protein [Actinomycetota bacterium]